jgi:hypothetical protein
MTWSSPPSQALRPVPGLPRPLFPPTAGEGESTGPAGAVLPARGHVRFSAMPAFERAVRVGLDRIVVLYHRSSTSYQIR